MVVHSGEDFMPTYLCKLKWRELDHENICKVRAEFCPIKKPENGEVGEGMSAPVYTWVIVYEGGYTEEKTGTRPADFADDIIDVPIAIIREGVK